MYNLNARQRRFVTEYLRNGGNGRLAAQEAGYTGDANALAVQSSRLLRNAKVRAALARPLEEEERLQDQVVSELKSMAFAPSAERIRNSDKLRALEVIAKALGMMKENSVEVQFNLGQVIREQSQNARPVQWTDLPDKPLQVIGQPS